MKHKKEVVFGTLAGIVIYAALFAALIGGFWLINVKTGTMGTLIYVFFGLAVIQCIAGSIYFRKGIIGASTLFSGMINTIIATNMIVLYNGFLAALSAL
jgi:hypothetical protein